MQVILHDGNHYDDHNYDNHNYNNDNYDEEDDSQDNNNDDDDENGAETERSRVECISLELVLRLFHLLWADPR